MSAVSMRQVEQDYLQRLHHSNVTNLIANYRNEVTARGDKPKRVYGTYNKNDYLTNFFLSKRVAGKFAEKVGELTVKLVQS